MIEIALFAGLVVAGYATRAVLELFMGKGEFCERVAGLLTRLVYYVLIPLAFTTTFARRGLMNLDAPVLLYYLVLIAAAYFVVRELYGGSERLVAFLLSAFPNSVFLGFPVCYALFGNIDVAAVFGTLTVALNVAVPDIMVKGKAPIRAVLTSTAFLGFATGVLLHYALPPFALQLHRSLWWNTLALSYIATYTMGLRIPPVVRGFKTYARLLGVVGVIRFLLAPLLSLPISVLTGFGRGELLQLAVVSATPPAVMNVLIAEKYGLNSQRAAVVTAALTALFLGIVFPVLAIVVKILL